MPVRIISGHSTETPTAAAARAQLEVERLGEREHGVLAHRVGRRERRRGEARHRRGDQHVALALREQARHEGAHAVQHAPDVHGEDPLVVRERRLPGEPAREHARVVADQVDGAEGVLRARGERLDLLARATRR